MKLTCNIICTMIMEVSLWLCILHMVSYLNFSKPESLENSPGEDHCSSRVQRNELIQEVMRMAWECWIPTSHNGTLLGCCSFLFFVAHSIPLSEWRKKLYVFIFKRNSQSVYHGMLEIISCGCSKLCI